MFEMKDKFSWKDRRPIAALHVASDSPLHKSPTNLAGWLHDGTIDVTDYVTLIKRFDLFIDGAIDTMRSFNAQGGVFWEWDGCRYGSYLGCPDLALALNVELREIPERCFARLRKAGFSNNGVTIRPGVFNFSTGKLTPPTDYFTNLLLKSRYARETWKCKVFYVDTNMENCGDYILDAYGNKIAPPILPAITFARLHQAMPDCLFIPEHENVEYHLWTAPYRELRGGETGTPPNIRKDIANAFSVLFLSENGTGDLLRANLESVKESLQKGDIPLMNGWVKSGETEELAKMLM